MYLQYPWSVFTRSGDPHNNVFSRTTHVDDRSVDVPFVSCALEKDQGGIPSA